LVQQSPRLSRPRLNVFPPPRGPAADVPPRLREPEIAFASGPPTGRVSNPSRGPPVGPPHRRAAFAWRPRAVQSSVRPGRGRLRRPPVPAGRTRPCARPSDRGCWRCYHTYRWRLRWW
jgi:hypothetical protein